MKSYYQKAGRDLEDHLSAAILQMRRLRKEEELPQASRKAGTGPAQEDVTPERSMLASLVQTAPASQREFLVAEGECWPAP